MSANPSFIFESRPDDVAPQALRIEGTMPGAVRGRYCIIGPGRSEIGGQPLHVFDSFGRVLAARLGGDAATLTSRHVRTPLLEAELAAGRMLQRRLFANKPARWSNLFDLDLANGCNHNVYRFGQHLIAAQDPGHFLLDPETLATLGPLECDGLYQKGTNGTPMARVDPATGRLVLWLQKPGLKDKVTFVELDERLSVAARRTCKLPSGLLHDVAFTRGHYVVTRFAELNPLKALWGARPIFEALKFTDKTALLHLVPRGEGAPRPVMLPARTHFHYFNAFEDDGAVVVDTIAYAGAVSFSAFIPEATRKASGLPVTPTALPQVIRYRIALDTLAIDERVMPGIACELPEVNPGVRGRSYRFAYACAKTERDVSLDPGAFPWFGGVGKLDFEANAATVWQAPAGATCSAPVFVADPDRSGEDAGFVLSWVQRPTERTSSLVILDAQRIEAGPVAQAHYGDLLGGLSHACFLPASG